jgi:NADPH-dependent 2,4-dienoyl-CoA reductase/sulfur reductase-like enzyme/Fe-S-cluster-containing hydrogenase component 2
MTMKRCECIIIGAGPAGLSAAIELASHGVEVVVFDENARPGGQLFKQTHKFFGSREHGAKRRGFRIGEDLLAQARSSGVTVKLNATVIGLHEHKQVTVKIEEHVEHVRGNCVIIATGAAENALAFPGWTLPGVIAAGGAQTMMHLHGVRPGSEVLMVGSGNVGLVVGYQLLQAGCDLKAVIDASPSIGGYGVHAAKIARTGVPFYMSHTIVRAEGADRVESATIAEVDRDWKVVSGSEKTLKVDTICLAVGLSPMSQLARMAGCRMQENASRGGLVPVLDACGRTSVPGIYAAGDVGGIEEASSAMIQGKIAATAAACDLGYMDRAECDARAELYSASLGMLRSGMFGGAGKGLRDRVNTDEGYPLSQSLTRRGFIADTEISHYPGIPSAERRSKGVTPVIECTQNIPCNPCQDACRRGCISVGQTLTDLPKLDGSAQCSACGLCVASCSGQAIFLVNECLAPGFATVSLAYEFRPLPAVGDRGAALDRSGAFVAEAEVIDVRQTKATDGTAVLTMKVPLSASMSARFFRTNAEAEK